MKNLKEVKEMVDAVSTPLDVTFDDFIGHTPAIKNLITFAKKIADTGTIISITGDSGTGKELFAKGIHFESGCNGPFIPKNTVIFKYHNYRLNNCYSFQYPIIISININM